MGAGENTLLIVAASGRALAEAAHRRSGFADMRIVVLDWFGDTDTIAAANTVIAVPRGRSGTFLQRPLLAAAAEVAPPGALLVVGSGFERRPALLARLARDRELLGNPPATIARVKDPYQFFPILDRLGIAHPRVSDAVDGDPGCWLLKRIGGAGGGHVRPARRRGPATQGHYAQERVPGRPVSALFLGGDSRARVVGLSEQWASPAPRRPHRYGGAATPADVSRGLAARISTVVEMLVEAFALRGLGSADFLVDGDEVCLLEVNPRPGATLDLFDRGRGGLFAAHVAACRETPSKPSPLKGSLRNSENGCLPLTREAPKDASPPSPFSLPRAPGVGVGGRARGGEHGRGEGRERGSQQIDATGSRFRNDPFKEEGREGVRDGTKGSGRASMIVYAERGLTVPPIDWPDWTADRPAAGFAVAAGEPICTVFGEGENATQARQSAEARAAQLLERLGLRSYALLP